MLKSPLTPKQMEYIEFYLQKRGPDHTHYFSHRDYIFIHYLLHITGEKTLQPFIDNINSEPESDNTIICLFNGEIYNYREFGDFASDGYCLIPVYKKYGADFVKHLDGEFAIVLFDFTKRQIILSSDLFATKPIYYLAEIVDSHPIFAVSSYGSAISRLLEQEKQANNNTNTNLNDKIKKIEANTTLIIDMDTFATTQQEIYHWDLRQYKTTFDDWISAFDQAIEKRVRHLIHPVFICLSSGYDSGAIACALNKQKIKYNSYTITATENMAILNQRFKYDEYMTNGIYDLAGAEFAKYDKLLKQICEPAKLTFYKSQILAKFVSIGDIKYYPDKHFYLTHENFTISADTNMADTIITIPNHEIRGTHIFLSNSNKIRPFKIIDKNRIELYEPININISPEDKIYLAPLEIMEYQPITDHASVGLTFIFSLAKQNKQLIYLSGQGADEIFSDYGFRGYKMRGSSCFGGLFPENLEAIFPWPNFYKSSQECFIAKEEFVGGSLGLEARYPFLDKDVVQEFLWLSAECKNANYKAPLYTYMNYNEYPFAVNEKIGFKVKPGKKYLREFGKKG